MESGEAPEDLYERVGTYLRLLFGRLAEPLEGDRAFAVELNDVVLMILVDPYGPKEGGGVLVYTLLPDAGLEITPDVAAFLLDINYEMPFGALGVRGDGRIALRQVVVGDGLSQEALYAVLREMATASAQIEDGLRHRFPGSFLSSQN